MPWMGAPPPSKGTSNSRTSSPGSASARPGMPSAVRASSNPMPQYRLSPFAEQDIEAILEWTHEHFGGKGRLRYEALLTRAIMDVAADPERAGSHARPEIAAGARTYHLRHSRDR